MRHQDDEIHLDEESNPHGDNSAGCRVRQRANFYPSASANPTSGAIRLKFVE